MHNGDAPVRRLPLTRAVDAYRDAAEALAGYATLAAQAAAGPDRVALARGLRAYAMDVVDAGVVADRLAGADWEQIAATTRLNAETLRDRYADVVARFAAGERCPWRPSLPDGSPVPLPAPSDA
jgi:hypothetical protein